MCSECGFYPCHPSCPNAEEEIYTCAVCKDEILAGRYAVVGDEYICDDCLFDMNGADFAERLGIMEII